jgi:hypothetical protein
MTDDAREALAREQRDKRARLGLVLIGLGLIGILWGVFHILESVPRPAKREFAYRTTDFQARSAVHGSFAGGLLRALAGLSLAVYGAHVRRKALGDDARGT